jgi:hypothetical protein
MRIIPNRNSLLSSLPLLFFTVLFQIFPALETFAGCIVLKGRGLEQPHPVCPPCKVTLIPGRRPPVLIIPERNDKGGNPQFPEHVQPEKVLLYGGIESYQHIAGNLVRLHMPDHLFQTLCQVQCGQVPGDVDVLFHLQFVQMPGLFLIHNPDVHTVQFYGLAGFQQIIHCRPSLRIGKEVVVQYLNPFSFGIQLFHRLHCPDIPFFLADEAEKAFTDAAP